MALKLTVRMGGAGGASTVNYTSQLRLWDVSDTGSHTPLLDAGMKSENGAASQFQFVLDDDSNEIPKADLTKNLPAHTVVTVSEDAPGYEAWLARGRIADKEAYRGDLEVGNAIAWSVTVDDANVDVRGLALTSAWTRSAESGRARILALITAFLTASPRPSTTISNHLVASGGEVTMPAKTYPAGTELTEIIDDCATTEGKIWAVVIHHVSSASHLCFQYQDEADHTNYLSTLSITDNSPNLSTSFPPIWDQGAAKIEDGQELATGVVSRYGADDDSFVFVEDAADVASYDYWVVPYNDSLSETAAQATARADSIREAKSREHVTHQVTIQLRANQVDLLCAGMSIAIRAAASMGGQYLGTSQTRRIAQLKWEPIAPEVGAVDGYYLAHMQLDRPVRLLAAGPGLPVGPKPPKAGSCEDAVYSDTFESYATGTYIKTSDFDVARGGSKFLSVGSATPGHGFPSPSGPWGAPGNFDIPVTAGTSYDFHAWAAKRDPGSAGDIFSIQWREDSGGSPANGILSTVTLKDGGWANATWYEITATQTAPVDAAWVTFGFTGTLDGWYLDDVSVTPTCTDTGDTTQPPGEANPGTDHDTYSPIDHVHQPGIISNTAPTVNDDSDDGHEVGLIWVDQTTNTAYILISDSPGAAVWEAIPDPDAAGLGWYNVTTYGATGDGSTDDTTSINSAIAALNSAGGGVLYFPAGTYLCSSALTTITIGGLVRGDGVDSVVRSSSSTANLFTITGYGAQIRDLLLDNSATTPTAGAAIDFDQHIVRVENVTITDFYNGIRAKGDSSWSITNCHITDVRNYGIYITNTATPDEGDWSISDCVISDSVGRSATAGIRVESSGGGKITNVKINASSPSTGYNNGIDVAISGSVTTVAFQVSNCSIENVRSHGISATSATGSSSWRLWNIVGNEFGLYTNNSGKAISMVSTDAGDLSDIAISSNVFHTDGTARSAVQITNCDNVTFVGNVLSDNFTSLYTNSGSTNVTEVGGGATDHGALTGLSDDDHTHYLNAARHLTTDHSATGHYEVVVSGTAPPVAVTNEAEDDWVYGWVSE